MGRRVIYAILIITISVMFFSELILGSVNIAFVEVVKALTGSSDDLKYETIVRLNRLPRALMALSAGAGLALAGLLMQTFFRNPLAGPSVLGISSGSSLGVGIAIFFGSSLGWMSSAVTQKGLIIFGALIGAIGVLSIILLISKRIKNNTSLLIFGLMVGYLVSAIVVFLQSGASKEGLQSFVYWGMGSFGGVQTWSWLIVAILTLVFSISTYFMYRILDIWMLGEEHIHSAGVSAKRIRMLLLLATGIITAVVTAYCGPIAFLGIAVPHLARGIMKSASHKIVIPTCVLIGMALGLFCDLLSRGAIFDGIYPLNTITSLVGAPIIIYVLLKGRRVF